MFLVAFIITGKFDDSNCDVGGSFYSFIEEAKFLAVPLSYNVT